MSTSEALKGCLTCFRQTDNFLRIAENDDDASDENVEAVFETHFWFTKDEYQDRIVCTSCWEKIDDFHKFYCEVKKVHYPRIKKELEGVPVKEGGDEKGEDEGGSDGEKVPYDESFLYTEVSFKEEPSAATEEKADPDFWTLDALPPMDGVLSNNDDESDDNKDEAKNSDSDSESSSGSDYKIKRTSSDTTDSEEEIPLAKRITKKRKRRRRKYARDDLDYTCCVCADAGEEIEPFATWYKMNLHFKQNHGLTGFMFCCNRRFCTKPLYVKHLESHDVSTTVRTDQKHCLECKCSFKDESGLARHMVMVHTPEELKQFKCDRCSKAFADQDLLNSHINWHDEVEKRNHHCAICNRYFTGAGNLQTHIMAHHSTAAEAAAQAEPKSVEKKFEKRKRGTPDDVAKQDDLIKQFVQLNCSRCDFVGENFKDLQLHAKNLHQLPTYSVVCCERRFSKRFRLYEHCLKHLNPNHFRCELCDKTFTDSHGLQHHRWFIHTPVSERPFKCDVCGDAFVKEYLLKAHMDRHLDKERKTHTCDSCGVTYTTLPQLKAHQQNVHGAMSDWVCDVCAKGFAHRALLERHRLTHTEEGQRSLKEQCEKCHKWLINRTSYLRHRKLCGNSTGPAKCDLCEHVSVNAHALSVHKKLNHTDRPKYACQYCGKEFKKQLRLKEHEANHAGIVLYKCPFCPRECNSSSNMYTHKKTAHAEQWAAVVAAKHSK
uniref:Transcription factor grauzone n=1 Tax=Culex pipiens TaxID=7175 RepID=A0A8D8DYK8_CULPI